MQVYCQKQQKSIPTPFPIYFPEYSLNYTGQPEVGGSTIQFSL